MQIEKETLTNTPMTSTSYRDGLFHGFKTVQHSTTDWTFFCHLLPAVET
jgi:hypothetical protein